MRPLPALAVLLPLLLAPPAIAAGGTGGASAPEDAAPAARATGVLPGSTGGTAAPDDADPVPVPVRATDFSVAPAQVAVGRPVTLAFALAGGPRPVRVRAEVRAAGARQVLTRVALGVRRPGRRVAVSWIPTVGPGRYVAELRVGGAGVARTARAAARAVVQVVAAPPPVPAPPPAPAPVVPLAAGTVTAGGVFPVQGPYSWGGAGARFGAARSGHGHQGQDVIAAEGTPVVAPRAGSVFWSAYQATGAGYYVVIRADDGRDYAFMHFAAGSVAVVKGARVAQGQRIGLVGATGDAQGAHLHFEIWPHGWWAAGSAPVDPLPQLLAWAGPSAPRP